MATKVTSNQARRRRRKQPARAQSFAVQAGTAGEQAPTVLSDYMTTEQLAAELKLNPWTLLRWRLQKKGPPNTQLGRRIFYRRSSVQAWLATQEQHWG